MGFEILNSNVGDVSSAVSGPVNGVRRGPVVGVFENGRHLVGVEPHRVGTGPPGAPLVVTPTTPKSTDPSDLLSLVLVYTPLTPRSDLNIQTTLFRVPVYNATLPLTYTNPSSSRWEREVQGNYEETRGSK